MKKSDLKIKDVFKKNDLSTCYTLVDGNLYKEFDYPLSIKDIDKFKYFKNHINRSFFFPFDFVYDKKKFYGYINKLILGKTLKESFLDSDLEKLSTKSLRLEKDIDDISENRIVIRDLHEENVLYDLEKLSVIDPDLYYIEKTSSIKEIKKENQESNLILFYRLFRDNLVCTKENVNLLKRIWVHQYRNIRASELIILTKEQIEKFYKVKIKTLGDLNSIERR